MIGIPESKAGGPFKHLAAAAPRWPWVLVSLAVLTGVPFWQWPAFSFAEKNQHFESTRFTSNLDEDRVTAVGISPDGKFIAYADADGVVLRGVQDAANHLLPSPRFKVASQLSWFPDQLHLLLSSVNEESGQPEIWKISVLREPPVLFRADAQLGTVSHSGSSVALTTKDGSELWVMGSNGENGRLVASAGQGARYSVLLWALNDQGLLVNRRPSPQIGSSANGKASAPNPQMVYEQIRLSDGQITTSHPNLVMGDACLLSSGELIYSRVTPEEGKESDLLLKVPIDPVTGAMGSAKEVYTPPDDPHVYGFSCSFAGDRIATIRIQGATSVFLGNLAENDSALHDVRRLSLDSTVAYPHGWSRDSRTLLYEASREPNRWQIYSQRLDRHDPEPIVSMNGSESRPTLTPDGKWLLFNFQEKSFGTHFLYRVNPGGGMPIAVPAGEYLNEFRCPVTSGTCLTISAPAAESRSFHVLDPVTGLGRELYRTPPQSEAVLDWDISPDGSTLVLNTPNAELPLQTVVLSTGAAQAVPYHSASGIRAVNWAANGKGFFIASASPLGDVLSYVGLTGDKKDLRSTSTGTWGVPSPDGKYLAFIDRSLDSNVWLLQAK